MGTQAPILAHDLRSISLASHAAKNFCSTVFGLCPLQEVIPYSVSFADAHPFEVNVTAAKRRGKGKEPEKREKRWKSKGRKPFQVVHLSDVHVDRSYMVSLAPRWREQLGADLSHLFAARFQHHLLQSHLLP